MNQKKRTPTQERNVKQLHCQVTGTPQLHKPGMMQPKMTVASQIKQPTAAPVAYRPQPMPKVLQMKRSATHQPVNQSGRASGAPTAPPAYCSQPTPKVLQTKMAGGQPHSPSSRPAHSPVASPAYQPQQQRPVQPKMVGGQKQAHAASPGSTTRQAHRPQPAPKVLQTKKANVAGAALASRSGKTPATAPVDKASTTPRVLQRHKSNPSQAPQKPQTPQRSSVCQLTRRKIREAYAQPTSFLQHTGINRATLSYALSDGYSGHQSVESGKSSDKTYYYYQKLYPDRVGSATHDAEMKLVSWFANELYYWYGDDWVNVRGSVSINSDQGPCTQCRHAMRWLRNTVPGLSMNVTYRGRYPVSGAERHGKGVQYGYEMWNIPWKKPDDGYSTGESGNWSVSWRAKQ